MFIVIVLAKNKVKKGNYPRVERQVHQSTQIREPFEIRDELMARLLLPLPPAAADETDETGETDETDETTRTQSQKPTTNNLKKKSIISSLKLTFSNQQNNVRLTGTYVKPLHQSIREKKSQ